MGWRGKQGRKMTFSEINLEKVFNRLVDLLKMTYDGANEHTPSILDLFGSTELTKEQKDMLENRFTYCITSGAVKDSNESLKNFLTTTLEKLREDKNNIAQNAYKWLESFLCDNKNAFIFCPIYIIIIKNIAHNVQGFFCKFTNTRKHGAKMYDAEGDLILHDFCDYSPSLSVEYVPSLFLVSEYGEQFEAIYNLYQEIIRTIRDVYYFSSTICQLESARKENTQECMKSLLQLKDEIMNNQYMQFDTDFPSEAQIEAAKCTLPKKVVKCIEKKPLQELSTELYHELKQNCGYALITLLAAKQKEQAKQNKEFCEIFSHIKDPIEKSASIDIAKYLLKHIDKLAEKKNKKLINKGVVAYLFYKWTNTTISESRFVLLYNSQISNPTFSIAQSTINSTHNHSPKVNTEKRTFDANVAELLEKYKKEQHSPQRATPTVSVEISKSIAGKQVEFQKTLA